MDIRQEELGDLVDKEMAATSAAIEEAVRRIDVSASVNLNLRPPMIETQSRAASWLKVVYLQMKNQPFHVTAWFKRPP